MPNSMTSPPTYSKVRVFLSERHMYGMVGLVRNNRELKKNLEKIFSFQWALFSAFFHVSDIAKALYPYS